MARLPSKLDLSGPENLRSGRAIAQIDTSGIGRGLASLGADIQGIAAEQKKNNLIMGGTTADGLGTRGLNDFERSFDSDTDYANFGKKFDEGVAKIGQEASQYISDPKARAAWLADFSNRTLPARNRVLDFAAGRMKEQRLLNTKSGLEGYQTVIADRNASEDLRTHARVNADASISALEKAGDLSPAEAQTWRDNVIRGGEFLFGQRELENDPSALVQAKGPIASIVAKAAVRRGANPDIALAIAHIESGLDPNARAGTSSAGGLFQFTDGTAARYGLSNKFNANENADAGARLTKDNTEGLRRDLGREPTPGEIYLAHFGGYGVAEKLGQVSPDTPTSAIFSPQAIAANRSILAGKTAGQVRDWADRKMADAIKATGGTSRPEWFTSQTPDKQLQLEQMAQSQQRQNDVAAAAQDKAQQGAANDDFNLRIATGDPTLTRQEILDSGSIDNGQKATLINSYEAKTKDDAQVADLIGAIGRGQKIQINSFDEAQAKLGDKGYDAFVAAVPTEQRGLATGAYVAATGYIPKKVQASLQQGAASTDPNQFASAMGMADALRTRAPTSFDNFDGGKQVRDNLTLFQHMVNDQGLSAGEASRKIIAMNDPEKRASREVLKPQADTLLKGLVVGDVTNAFDTNGWWPGGEPGGGLLPAQQNALLAEYKDFAQERFYETGDADAAKSLAIQDMKRTWGPSTISGSAQLMRMPPENHYPAAGGSYEYLRDDAMKTAQDYATRTFPGRVVTNIAIAPGVGRDNSWSTRGDIDAKRPPRYRLFYTYDQDGQQMVDEVMGAPWGVDATGLAAATAKAQARIGAQFDEVHKQASTNIDDFNAGEAAANKALAETPGPSWMKARAAEMARERVRQEAGERRMKAEQSKPDHGSNIPNDRPTPSQDQVDIMGNPTGF